MILIINVIQVASSVSNKIYLPNQIRFTLNAVIIRDMSVPQHCWRLACSCIQRVHFHSASVVTRQSGHAAKASFRWTQNDRMRSDTTCSPSPKGRGANPLLNAKWILYIKRKEWEGFTENNSFSSHFISVISEAYIFPPSM